MKTLLPLCILLFVQDSYSQTYYDTINHNNTSALISNHGTVFEDMDNFSPGYEVPKGSGLHAINSAQFWFAAKDSVGDVKVAIGGHSQLGHDVFPGPYSYNHNYDSTYNALWGDAIWTICQAQIDQFRTWWECENGLLAPADCANVQVPTTATLALIYDWPAHGNVANGEDYWQAPFYDYDQDGNYNPSQGDYPIIKGCCATYMIQNDDRGLHTQSNSEPIGLEIHTMFYHYKTWDFLNDATFVEVTVKNTSENDYTDFQYGIRVDPSLGNYLDNNAGSDSTTNMMYFYNTDNDDELGYGIDPPAIGVVALDSAVNACTFGPPGAGLNEYWNTMSGLEANGLPVINPFAGSTTFEYSDDPNDPTGWSQYSQGLSGGDLRGLMTTNHGPLDGVENGGQWGGTLPVEIKQTYAILYARNGDHLQNVTQLLSDAAAVKEFHDNDSDVPCEGWWWGIDELQTADFSVYPNPASNQLTIENGLELEMQISIMNIEGKIVYTNEFSGTSSTIDVSNLKAGIYLIQITTDSGNIVKRVIIE
jgi:hypothetical protein